MPNLQAGYDHVHGYCPRCRKVKSWAIVGAAGRYRTTYQCEGACGQMENYYWELSFTVADGTKETLPLFQSGAARGEYAIERKANGQP